MQPQRPSRLDTIEVYDVISRHHAEIAGLADLLRERLQNRVPQRAQHGCRNDVQAQPEKPSARNEAALSRLALDQPVARDTHQAVRGRLGNAEQDPELGDAKRTLGAHHGFENRHRLDSRQTASSPVGGRQPGSERSPGNVPGRELRKRREGVCHGAVCRLANR